MHERSGLPVTAAAAAQTLPTVKVATTPIDVGAEVLYANDMGFFRKHGHAVDVQFIDNGAAIASAVASGAIDVAQGNVVTLATNGKTIGITGVKNITQISVMAWMDQNGRRSWRSTPKSRANPG